MNYFLLIFLGITLSTFLFINLYPSFGAKKTKLDLESIKKSPNFHNGKFINQEHFPSLNNARGQLSILKDFINGNPLARPEKSILVKPYSPLTSEADQAKIVWFGHSSFFIEMEGQKLLLDPMFSKYPSPVPPFGGSRFSQRPLHIDDLPHIDAVLISHDHYDHLDYKSIMKLKDKVRQFHVPLGVEEHLLKWGVKADRIYTYDWWDEYKLAGIKLVCTPAKHFSGRTLFTHNRTLWSSWAILGQNNRIFFSGDGGYGPHFEQIGNKYGPFDITLVECGQYDMRWKAIHMMPEETVQAHLDLQGKLLIPMHWGAFTLAFHDWTEPVERAVAAAQKQDLLIATPRISETIILGSSSFPEHPWWNSF